MVLESARKIALTILVVFIGGFYIDDVVRRFKKNLNVKTLENIKSS